MEACITCGVSKGSDCYYKRSDGRVSTKCKECTKEASRKNYRAHLDQYKAYERSRVMAPQRVEARKRYQKTSAGNAIAIACQRKFYASEHGRKSMVMSHRKYRENNPVKCAAHLLVRYAIRDGLLIRKPCEVCGNEKTQAHHDDYTKPLDVRWLCLAHHREWHAHNTPICPDQRQELAA